MLNYFANLDFYPDRVELGPGLMRKRLYWTVTSFLLLASGIFFRQCIGSLKTGNLDFSLSNFRLTVAIASSVVALAVFPPYMRWFNRRVREASWGQVLWAFSFGFFVDLASSALVHFR
jgi:hypothetical protein